ncbi:MAG: ATP-dependent DNA helicase [Lachnospiraceae bacterium]|nr:ATP-dependent DNA helicase [Lachnospiraceae bacterium]
MEQVRISVRNLVEFVLRSGDIDNRRGRTAQKEAMQEGSRIHRKIQRRMGASYHAEVPLKLELELESYVLVIEGRADGILIEGEQVTVDEIKGIYQDVHSLTEAVPVHLAQAKCYGYMYGVQAGLTELTLRMTYCNLDTEEIRYFHEAYSLKELAAWFESLVESYRKWSDFQYRAKQKRQVSIQNLPFPFPYREGQKELVAGVYRTIRRGKILFIQAPTGTGKTISTVFPAVRGVGEGYGEKIFYLTAKTITRTVAWEAFELLRRKEYQGSVITITAKEKLCLCQEMECNPVSCPYAKGHYDRVNDAVFDLVNREKEISGECLMAQARAFRVCPFEMCLDTALWMDVIICDYNYVFDPNVYLKRFFAEGVKGDYIFLIDEAHNLVERGREMYSASLYKEAFLEIKKLVKEYSGSVARSLEKCNKLLLEMKRQCQGYQLLDTIGGLIFQLLNLAAAMDEFLQKNMEFPEKKKALEFYLELRHFLNMYERLDENYVIYTRHQEDGRFLLKLFCVNPAVNLQSCLNKGRSAVFFSATLLPIQYYKKLLSTREDNYAVYAQTVFSREQSLILVASDVSSKYTRRNQQEFQRIAAYIREVVWARKGNYMVFFPSYKMLEQVLEACMEQEEGIEFQVQRPGMREEEREEFLQAFSQEREGSFVGLCVMGGIFSEGIDLKGERLVGAVIVGTGIPQISEEREILKQFYEEREGNGFDYAFRYPGMNKVMQSAGRVIRTAADHGVILLLDERFLQQEYQRLFPREWDGFQVCRRETVRGLLRGFWDKS